ncbi:MAG: alpha-L-fucosidase, partial [Bacteroidota bacterium]
MLLLFTGMQVVNAQQTPPLRDKTKWLRDAKFGMLISWGPYAQVGGGEDVMAKYRLNAKDYDKLIKSFTATHCNPEAWVLQAKAAGMRYIVFSAKGPDGFSMYEGKFKERDITGTPYRQDVLMQLVRACNKYRMPLGVYYSRIDRLNPEYHPKMSGGPKII